MKSPQIRSLVSLPWLSTLVCGARARAGHRFLAPVLSSVAILLTCGLALCGGAARAQDVPQWYPVSSTGPSARRDAMMAYDSDRGVVVLFGGQMAMGGLPSDTWEWDGSTWKQINSAVPINRYRGGMVYDSARKRTVRFGGLSYYNTPNSETHEWDGSKWTYMTAQGPGFRYGLSMAFDTARGRTLLFGGTPGDGTYGAGTWEYKGPYWTKIADAGPPAREGAPMVYDSARDRPVLFGGLTQDQALSDDTWEWNNGWQQVASDGPPARQYAAMAYDSARGRTVLFGGRSSVSSLVTLGDTWEWNGGAWTRVNVPGPFARAYTGMVYDSARNRIVLFGGVGADGQPLGDTWEFGVGATWQLAFAVQPSGAAWDRPFAVQPVVHVLNAQGGVMTPYTGPVTLSIKPGTGTPGATLGGTTTVNAVEGVVTFSNVSINQPGSGYVLVASSGAVPLAESAAFNVAQRPFAASDAVRVLRLASGMAAAHASDLQLLNVVNTGASAGTVDIHDAVSVARKAAGLETNP